MDGIGWMHWGPMRASPQAMSPVAHGSLAWQIESATRRWRRQLPVTVWTDPHTNTVAKGS